MLAIRVADARATLHLAKKGQVSAALIGFIVSSLVEIGLVLLQVLDAAHHAAHLQDLRVGRHTSTHSKSHFHVTRFL